MPGNSRAGRDTGAARYVSAVVFLAALAGCGHGGPEPSPVVGHVRLPDGVDHVDLPSARAGNWFCVPVRLNGAEVGWFVVDTGANMTVVDSSVVSKAKLRHVGRISVNLRPGRLLEARELSVGSVRVEGALLYECDLSFIRNETGIPCTGIIGADILGAQPVTLDYRADTVTFHSPAAFAPPSGEAARQLELPWVHQTGNPIISGSIDGVPVPLLVDTGSYLGLYVFSPFASLYSRVFEYGSSFPSSAAEFNTPITNEWSGWARQLEVLGRTWPRVSAQRPAGPAGAVGRSATVNRFAGVVGSELMRDGRFTFDFAHDRMWAQWPPPELADEMLKRLGDPAGADLAGITPLMRAAQAGREDVVRMLLQAGAAPDVESKFNSTALALAAETGHAAVVDALLSGGADANHGADGVTALHLAAERGFADVVQALLDHGARVDPRTWWKETPLHQAARTDHVDVVRLLLARGSDPDAADSAGYTPLIDGARSSLAVVEALLDKGARIDHRARDGSTALHAASRRRTPECAAALLDRGSNVNAADRQGRTPLMTAAQVGNVDVMRLLLSRGADPRSRTGRGQTAAHFVLRSGSVPALTMVLDAQRQARATQQERSK